MTGIADTPQGKRASIKRASKKARSDLRKLDAQALADLDKIYRTTAAQITADIEAAAPDGYVRLDAMRQLLNQVDTRINQLSVEMDRQLSFGFDQAAVAGSTPFATVVGASALMQVNHDAVQFVRNLIANDGLQLSDRIWRIDRHAREVVGQAVQQAVVQGYSASQAADEFLRRGDRIPADILAKMKKADATRIGREAGKALLHDNGSPRHNAMRLFRTEINRAHGEAYQAASFEHPDTIGTRFLLSPNHRQQDICNMHARVNRYGLGPGVYPKDRNPWPAHPNTISFTEVVFFDEVSSSDKSGKQTRIDFLKKQKPGLRASMLGGKNKRAAFDAGHIPESAIATPWKTIKKRLERKGINTDKFRIKNLELKTPPASVPIVAKAPPKVARATTWKEAEKIALDNDLADHVSWKGVHVDVANAWNQSMSDTLHQFPELRDRQQFLGSAQASNRRYVELHLAQKIKTYAEWNGLPENDPRIIKAAKSFLRKKAGRMDPRVYAHSRGGRTGVDGIVVNEKHGKRADLFLTSIQRDVSKGWHPEGTGSLRSVADHEMGHEIDKLLKLRDNKRVNDLFSTWRTDDPDALALSRYARDGKHPVAEFIAESWAEIAAGSPRPVAAKMKQIINDEYAKMRGLR